jgi:protein disulfide-isomerase A1
LCAINLILTDCSPFSHGVKTDYTGGRTQDTIVSWIKKKTGPVSQEVDCQTMQEKAAADKLAMHYFGELSGSMFDAFMEVANDVVLGEKAAFYHTTDSECASHWGASANGIALTRNFDEPKVAYTGDANGEAVATWMKSSSVPTLMVFSEDFIEPIFADHNPALFLFTEEEGTDYQGVFSQAAKDLQGEIFFVTSGVTEGIQARLAEFVGVGSEDMPTLRLIDPRDQLLKFVWSGDVKSLSADDVSAFVKSFKDGELKPHLKSEEVPEDNSGALTTIVGKNWEEVVGDETKDVLIKYYAPWCGHCKALAPTWEALATDVADISDLIIADFDATANEVAGLEIRGYPTLKFYPKDNKAGVDYNGGRDLEDFQKWLSENSSAYKAGRPGTHEDL